MQPEKLVSIFAVHGYEYIDIIGKGGYGTVYRVYSSKYNDEFVIKMVNNTESAEAEVQSLMKLHHPNIISMYDYFIVGDHLFIVFEYCPNGTLVDAMGRGSEVNEHMLRDYLRQLLNACAFCHENFIAHRDIKPENVLVDKYGRLKLTDFGISQDIENDNNVRAVGSLLFMAPELLSGKCNDLFAADVWALGITFYTMIFKSFPWPTLSNTDWVHYIRAWGVKFQKVVHKDDKLMQLLKKMLKSNPIERITASDALKSLYFTVQSKVRKSSSGFPIGYNILKSNHNLLSGNQDEPELKIRAQNSSGDRIKMDNPLPDYRLHCTSFCKSGNIMKMRRKNSRVLPASPCSTFADIKENGAV